MTEALIMFGVLVIIIALGVPIPISVIIACATGAYLLDLPLVLLAQSAYDSLEGIPLMTIPLFVFAGAAMERGGMAGRLVNFASTMVGRYSGSLGLVTIVGCTFFAALSGSGPATTAAVGAVTIPAMIREKYDAAFGGALAASGGALGSLIPPSNLMIIYGIVSDNSIPKLFLAGIIPGIFASGVLLACAWVIAKKRGYGGSGEPFEFKRTVNAAWESKWSLLAPVIILGGIYSGIFTATEAASVAVFYSLFVGIFIHRELSMEDIRYCLRDTALISGTVVIILGPAKAYGQLLSLMEVPTMIGELLTGVTQSPFLTLMIITFILILTGMVIETIAQIILFTPLFLPIVTALGVDPLVFGIVMVIGCEIGFLTPPVGVNLFVAARITNLSIEKISVAAIPFLFAYVLVIVFISLFPQMVLTLPNLAYG